MDKTKTELTSELENLARQLERTKYQTEYLERVESQNKQFSENMREKETVTRTQQELINELRLQNER